MNYPKHIYEPSRREVAVSYIQHELSKYLPSATGPWKDDLHKWFDGTAVGLFPVRDFWNGFYGIAMGFKLYIHLIEFITGENVDWNKEEIEIEKLSYTDFGEYEPHHLGDEPIVVTQKQVDSVDKMVVYDGNNRVNQAVKRGDKTIWAFVGKFSDERRSPVNFWVPTLELLELVHLAKHAWEDKDDATYNATVVILRKLLSFSESAKFEMKDRAVHGPEEFTKKILAEFSL